MAPDKKQLTEVWDGVAKEIEAGNLVPRNEQGEEILDIREDWTDGNDVVSANPAPSFTSSVYADNTEAIAAYEDTECALDDLFEELEGLDLSADALEKLGKKSSTSSAGLKRGFLLGDKKSSAKDDSQEKQQQPKSILKKYQVVEGGTSTSIGKQQHQPSSSSATTSKHTAPQERKPSTAFTGQVVERTQQVMPTNPSNDSSKPEQRVSRFKQRFAGNS